MRRLVLSITVMMAVGLMVGCGPKADTGGVNEPGEEAGVRVEIEAEDPEPEPGPEKTTPEITDEDEEMAPPAG